MDFTLQQNITEQQFIDACANFESWAQKIVYEEHYAIMYPLCCRYAIDEEQALDILHDGFIKVFRNIHKYKIGTSLAAWIRTIMVNTAIDQYRKNTKRRVDDIETAIGVQDISPDVISEMSAEAVLDCLKQLSPAYRAVFNLYVVEGFSHKEIAEKLDITESTSRSNLVKARTKLKVIIYNMNGSNNEG
jgi:RNA polymerase sigma factor (sigma-70 family)